MIAIFVQDVNGVQRETLRDAVPHSPVYVRFMEAATQQTSKRIG